MTYRSHGYNFTFVPKLPFYYFFRIQIYWIEGKYDILFDNFTECIIAKHMKTCLRFLSELIDSDMIQENK